MSHASRELAREIAALSEADRRDLVGEAFHTFGELAARALARRFCMPFEDCREAIDRLRHRVQ